MARVDNEGGGRKSARPKTAQAWLAWHELSGKTIGMAERGDEEALRNALRRGADPRARGPHGETALIAAARAGNEACVAMLLKAGADPLATGVGGMDALMVAVWNRQEVCARLLAPESNPHARDLMGKTALLMAAVKGSMPLAQMLLDAGWDVAAVEELRSGKPGRSAAQIAKESGHAELALWLSGGARASQERAEMEAQTRMAAARLAAARL